MDTENLQTTAPSTEPTPSGRLQVYTGDGKGKTTAAVGQAVRACGQGLSVLFLQFMKRDWPGGNGEIRSLEKLGCQVLQMGAPGFAGTVRPEDADAADEALDAAGKAILERTHDLIILDEALCALGHRLVNADSLSRLVAARGPVELVLTGRGCPLWLLNRADLVTEMRPVKQYTGPAKAGIEY